MYKENLPRVIAVVPVKKVSERVPNKNFREFTKDGSSLLDILLEKLLKIKTVDHIYISTNYQDLSIESDNKISLIDRDDTYCNNITSWSDVIYNIVNSIPEDDNSIILWCHTTTPLFDEYQKALNKFIDLDKNNFNSLVVVEKLKEFIIDDKGRPWNYSYGVWHPYSQNLPSLYKISGSLFINYLAEMKKTRYVINTKPFLYEIDSKYGIDIDTKWEFKMAQILNDNKNELNNI